MDQLLSIAKRSGFTIPRFQRNFIWNSSQTKLLLDSIARNYPIGSILLLSETNPGEPLLKSRPIQAVIADINDTSAGVQEIQPNSYYILDGQQRLTSILRVLLQAPPDECYYFDLRKLRDFHKDPDGSEWIVKRKISTKMTVRYLRSYAVVDRERCQELVDEYFENNDTDLKNSRELQRKASARVNGIFETIRNYDIPYVVIDRTESLEAICRIFETINSTGTKLTTFDLAVARFFPEPDLQTLWETSQSDHEILRRYEVDGERILQVIALLDAIDRKIAGEVTRNILLNLEKSVVGNLWTRAVDCIVLAYQWAEKRGVAPRMFPNEALMVPLAAFFSQADVKWEKKTPGFSSVLDKWYFASCLQKGISQASNYRVAEATLTLLKWRTDGTLPTIPKVFLTADEVFRLSSKDSRYRAILAFLRWQTGVDLWTGTDLDSATVQDHHIFPAAMANHNKIPKPALDSVGNRLLISATTNQMLKDRRPQDYLVTLLDDAKKSGTQKMRLESLRKACIILPVNRDELLASLDSSNAEAFIKIRSGHILDSLSKILEDVLIREESDDAD